MWGVRGCCSGCYKRSFRQAGGRASKSMTPDGRRSSTWETAFESNSTMTHWPNVRSSIGEVRSQTNKQPFQRRLVHEGEAVRITNSNEIRTVRIRCGCVQEKYGPFLREFVRSTGALSISRSVGPRRLAIRWQSDSDNLYCPKATVTKTARSTNQRVNVHCASVSIGTQADSLAGTMPVGRRVSAFFCNSNSCGAKQRGNVGSVKPHRSG